MHLNIAEKEDTLIFDLTLPSISKIQQMQGPKNSNQLGVKPKQVAKEDEIKYTLLTDSQIDTISNKRKTKGELKKKVLGIAELRPRVKKNTDYELEKKQIDKAKNRINIEEIKDAILPPAFIKLEDDVNDPKDKRVGKSDEWLHTHIMNLYREKSEWKLEEVERKLTHPKAGVQRMLQKLCKMDTNTKKYTLQKQYQL